MHTDTDTHTHTAHRHTYMHTDSHTCTCIQTHRQTQADTQHTDCLLFFPNLGLMTSRAFFIASVHINFNWSVLAKATYSLTGSVDPIPRIQYNYYIIIYY